MTTKGGLTKQRHWRTPYAYAATYRTAAMIAEKSNVYFEKSNAMKAALQKVNA